MPPALPSPSLPLPALAPHQRGGVLEVHLRLGAAEDVQQELHELVRVRVHQWQRALHRERRKKGTRTAVRTYEIVHRLVENGDHFIKIHGSFTMTGGRGVFVAGGRGARLGEWVGGWFGEGTQRANFLSRSKDQRGGHRSHASKTLH